MSQSVAAWLAGLELSRYVDTFAENEIDEGALPHLTEDDLKEMGIAIGPRRKILAALATFNAEAPASPAPPPATPLEAERRQLTVLFVDLVGSTALSGRLDPEDMLAAITGYQNTVAGEITRFDGHVAKYMGDGVLCYFGWPTAHEDDAERAARAALEALGKLRLANGEALQARAGIATGIVVVGDLIGEGAAQEEAVVGETPNLAARMQALAQPGQVAIAETTRPLLGDLFELTDLGPQELKGISGSTAAYVVEGERALDSRFAARRGFAVTDMVGRDHELGLMLERWSRARAGEGQLLLVTGEAGIGKSRLLQAMIDAIKGTPHLRVGFQCSPYHSESSLYPAIQHLAFAAGIQAGDSVDEKLDKLEAILKVDAAPLLAALMDIPAEHRYGALELTPQQQRARTMQALIDQLIALSAATPVLFVLEDAHWIDASTLELLDLALDRVAEAPVLVLVTARPTFVHGFGGHPIVSRLALNRLGRDQVSAIVAEITGGKALPDELMEEIAAKTDGVPLFVEELTKTVLESGGLRELADRYELTRPLSHLAIPSTLHDSLMARLDRLQPVKEVAQIAACIGRHFDFSLIAKVSPLGEDELAEALDRLVAAELIFRRGAVPEATFTFKHALVRDAAYESLLRSRRGAIHARLVDALAADGGAAPELLAQHASAAGLKARAFDYWREAGTLAAARPAYGEAAGDLEAALKLVPEMDDPEAWRERELEVLVQLAQIQMARYGYSSKETRATFERANANIDATRNMDLRMANYYGMWIGPYMGADFTTCLELSTRFTAEVDSQEAPIPIIIAHRLRAATLISMGRSPEALDELAVSFAIYAEQNDPDFASRFPQEPGVQLQCYQLLALWMCGHIDQAIEVARKALETGRELRHANTFCYAVLRCVALAMFCRDYGMFREANDDALAMAREHDMTLWIVFCEIHDRLFESSDDDRGALDRLDSDFETYGAMSARLWMTLYLAEQAKEFLRWGDLERAEAAVTSGLEYVEAGQERWVLADLYRVQGAIALARSDEQAADDALDRAVAVAREQGAKPLELRAATDRARLWAAQGRSAEAKDLLAPLYEAFTEGFETRDLIEAGELLASLG